MDVSKVSHDFQGCFMIFKEVSGVFQGSFKKSFKVFQKEFHVAWNSSQLPEQKEGLFLKHPVAKRKDLLPETNPQIC